MAELIFLNLLPSGAVEATQGADQSQNQTQTGTGTAQPTQAPEKTQDPLMGMVWSIGLPILMIGVIWFLMMRPQRKREKQMEIMQNEMKVGENVITSAGLYGKIASIGHDAFIIEFGADGGGRAIRVPVRKTDVVGIKSPSMTPPPVVIAEDKPAKKKKDEE